MDVVDVSAQVELPVDSDAFYNMNVDIWSGFVIASIISFNAVAA